MTTDLNAVAANAYHYPLLIKNLLHTPSATALDVDLAMRWGYGWTQGPFETRQAAGCARSPRRSPPTSRTGAR